MMDAEQAPGRQDRPDENSQNHKSQSSESQIPETEREVTAIEVSDSPAESTDVGVEEGGQPPEPGMTTEESAQVISQLQEGNRQMHDKLLRARADFENLKRRIEREKIDQIQAARKVIFRQLLDVLDNFERALDSAEEPNNPFVVGVNMIYRQFREFMNQNQVAEIVALGQEFNPHLHEAMAQQKTVDYPENTVIEVFQKGYLYRDKLLRAAQVKVAIKFENANDVETGVSEEVDQPTDEN